eukprot:c40828_g1_i1.p1 GENE.c40828_g1_i1~~c40828_g1_i1.p1  ORF type:complete len:122 (+),score=23.47 c40828_g1_i1:257-622(+)
MPKSSSSLREAIVHKLKEGKMVGGDCKGARCRQSHRCPDPQADLGEDQEKKVGGPRKLDDRTIRRMIVTGEVEALQAQGIAQVNAQTIRNALHQAGVKAIVKKRRPALTLRHRKQYRDWTG